MSKETYIPWDSAEFLNDDETIVEYLRAALEENDPSFFVKAIGNVARAKGMTSIAQETRLGRQNLYKALSGERDPRIGTLMKVLDAFGVRLTVAPSRYEDVEKEEIHPMSFRDANGNPDALRGRIIRLADDLAEQTGLEITEDGNLGGKYLLRPGKIATRVNIYERSIHGEPPRGPRPPGLRVNLWPASTAKQADRFCRAVIKERFLALNEQGWTVEPNLNFSFAGKKLFWVATDLQHWDARRYLECFFSGQRPYGKKSWHELLPLAETWEGQGLIDAMAWQNIQVQHNTKRQSLDVNPEFSVYRDWEFDKVIELEEQGQLEAHIMDALAVPLATWGEKLELAACNVAASVEGYSNPPVESRLRCASRRATARVG